MNIVKPVSEKQALFLESQSDLTFLVGAGVGKTYSLLLKHLEHKDLPEYRGAFVMKTAHALHFPLEEASKLYAQYGVKSFYKDRKIVFPSGAEVKFKVAENFEKTSMLFCGKQFDVVTVDNASQLDLGSLFYIMSRIRGRSTAPNQMFLGCNADEESDLRPFVLPWLDSKGYPDITKDGNEYHFINDPEFGVVYVSRRLDYFTHSVKVIHDQCTSNKFLMEECPKYIDGILSLSEKYKNQLYYNKW